MNNIPGFSIGLDLLGNGLLTAGGFNDYWEDFLALSLPLWTNFAFGQTYGFSIPSDKTILGIQVRINRAGDFMGSFPTSRTKDYTVNVLKNSILSTTNNAIAGDWPHTPTQITYGSTSDLWGETWAPADINSANFGAGIAAQAVTTSNNASPFIDTVEIAVTYEDAGPAVDVSAEYLPVITDQIDTAITNARTGANNKYFNIPIVNDVQIMFIHISQ